MHELASDILAEHGIEYLSEYLLVGRTLFKRIYLPYSPGDDATIENSREAGLALAASLTDGGFGIVNESPQLKPLLDKQFGKSNLNVLAASLNRSLDPSGLFSAAE